MKRGSPWITGSKLCPGLGEGGDDTTVRRETLQEGRGSRRGRGKRAEPPKKNRWEAREIEKGMFGQDKRIPGTIHCKSASTIREISRKKKGQIAVKKKERVMTVTLGGRREIGDL